ncbi:hypothetical protein AgCh_029143 [Apium graveolens]
MPHNPPRRGTWARDNDSYQQPTYQTNTARVRVPLEYPEGGPRLDTCMQSTQGRHPLTPATNDLDLEDSHFDNVKVLKAITYGSRLQPTISLFKPP